MPSRTPFAWAILLILAVGAAACGDRHGGSVACGFAALTGPLAIKQAFSQGNMLDHLPDEMPATLPVRMTAGPAWRATLDSARARWQVRVADSVTLSPRPGYAVLVVDPQEVPLGVLAFEGTAVRAATRLGTLTISDTVVPLLGVHIEPSAFATAECPLFPDSLR